MKKIIRITKYNYPNATVRLITDKCNTSLTLNVNKLRRLSANGWNVTC